MKVHLKFEGMAILYKTFGNRKEMDLEFQGTTLADLLNTLLVKYGTLVRNALLDAKGDLDANGDLDAEIRIMLNDDYLIDERMAVILNDGDAVTFSVAG
jgi:hypothetical protein